MGNPPGRCRGRPPGWRALSRSWRARHARDAAAQRWVQRRLWNHVDRVLSVSSRLAERMSGEVGFPLERIRVIQKRFRSGAISTVDRQGSRQEGPWHFAGHVGHRHRWQNGRGEGPCRPCSMPWCAFSPAGRRFAAVIAGSGPLFEETSRLAASLDLPELRMLGNRDDVRGACSVRSTSSYSAPCPKACRTRFKRQWRAACLWLPRGSVAPTSWLSTA